MRALIALVGAAAALAPGRARADGEWKPRCAGHATVRGIDVSKWQGEVDWRAVRAAGIRFAFVRVSDGLTVPDEAFARNWRAAREAGVLRGAYQYFRPEEDPVEQADLLLATMGALRAGDLPPALDLEVSGELAPRELVRRVSRWVERVHRATGVRPVVYATARHWAVLTGNSRRFRAHALWVAHHDVDCPDTPSGWRRWTFHQRSKQAQIAGVTGRVDENLFRGTLRALRRIAVRSERRAARAWARWKRRAGRESEVAREARGSAR
ncbi:MAG TPA: GH25 family lysozyme [Kofleriaceae bacterium]|nr:GH25 family lysozyme [Kofleriaceae bacterium]